MNAAALYPVKSNVTDDAKYSIFYAQSYTIGNFMMPNILYRKVQPYHVIIHVTGVSKCWLVQSFAISQRRKDIQLVKGSRVVKVNFPQNKSTLLMMCGMTGEIE